MFTSSAMSGNSSSQFKTVSWQPSQQVKEKNASLGFSGGAAACVIGSFFASVFIKHIRKRQSCKPPGMARSRAFTLDFFVLRLYLIFRGIMPVTFGTAGHIDHGKTSLVKALTGMETDTLKEEKARGLSIDLGFAFIDLPGQGRAAVCPERSRREGHHRGRGAR